MATTYDPTTTRGLVRLLLNDVADPWVFQDAEIDAFLTLEGQSVKKAAAQAIETNATNMVLAMRVLRSQDVATDGAKVADAMRAQAKSLREQADLSDDDGAFFDIVSLDSTVGTTSDGTATADWWW
jgi:hypothetical protein